MCLFFVVLIWLCELMHMLGLSYSHLKPNVTVVLHGKSLHENHFLNFDSHRIVQ